MASKFDRVVTGFKKLNKNETLERMDRKAEGYMQGKANKAMSEGKETKAKAIAAAEGVRKAVFPTDNVSLAATLGGVQAGHLKLAGKAAKAIRAEKIAEKAKSTDKAYSKWVAGEKNAVDALAKFKGVNKVKVTAGEGKGTSKFVNRFSDKNIAAKDEMKAKDFKNDFSLADGGKSRVKEEFTSRGKKVGEPIKKLGTPKGIKAKQDKFNATAKRK